LGTGKPVINAYAGETWTTGQKDEIFSLSVEGNRGAKTIPSTPLEEVSYDVKSLSRTLGAENFHGFCCSSVVMVSPTRHGNADHLGCLVQWSTSIHGRIRNPLPKPVMGSGLIERTGRGFEKPREVLLMPDEEVSQTFLPHASENTFTDRICPARVGDGVRRTLMPPVVAMRAKCESHFRSFSRTRYVAVCPYAVASPSWRATQSGIVIQ